MKYLWLFLLIFPLKALAAACPVTVGTLTLNCTMPRTSGVSPLLVFVDCTQSTTTATLSGGGTVFQGVSFATHFGDPNASGTGTWAYGARPGQNSMNTVSGAPISAHLYVLPTASTTDLVVTIQENGYDGQNIATCTLSATVQAPSGANGFPNTSTVCVTASATIGANCPAGAAAVTNQANLGTALTNNLGNGKRVLFKCGDTFTGTYSIASTLNKATIGAYGGCENTTTSRPKFTKTTAGSIINFNPQTPTDIRLIDIDFEDGTFTANATGNGGGLGEKEITLYNLACNGFNACYYMNEPTESGVIASTANHMNSQQGTYWAYAENNCINASSATFCGFGSYNEANYFSVKYNAIMGNNLDGTGAQNTGSGIETLRIPACRYCIISNNTLSNANNSAAQFKFNCGNTFSSNGTPWLGQYCEYFEISDNQITGNSGGWPIEISPQCSKGACAVDPDERFRFGVVERNFFNGTFRSKILISGSNISVRDNVFYQAPSAGSDYSIQVAQRSVEPVPDHVEVYNNTCYFRVTEATCVGIEGGDGASGGNAATNTFVRNNLFYNNGSNVTTVVNTLGTNSTISNNTSNSSLNPAVTNGSTAFSNMLDFKPTASFSGAIAVPGYFDASGLSWIDAYTLGAVSQAAPAQ